MFLTLVQPEAVVAVVAQHWGAAVGDHCCAGAYRMADELAHHWLLVVVQRDVQAVALQRVGYYCFVVVAFAVSAAHDCGGFDRFRTAH